MRNPLFHNLEYFALAPNKREILKSTIRPIHEVAAFRLGFLKGRFCVEYTLFYVGGKHGLGVFDEVKYVAWLDENKVPRRFSKSPSILRRIRPNDSLTIDGSINETK